MNRVTQTSTTLSIEAIAELVEDYAPESNRLDFKETLVLNKMETKRDLVRDVTAFANALGGWIIVGIGEEGMPHHAASWAHLSTADAEGIRKQVLDLYSSHIDPAIPGFDVRVELVPDTTSLVIVSIPASHGPHAVTGFGDATDYYIRVGDRKRQMTHAELQAAFAQAGNRSDTPQQRDSLPNGQSAIEEALQTDQATIAGLPFFFIAGAPAALHADALDLQSRGVRHILAENADGRTIETTLGWVISKATTAYRGIAASIGPYAFSLRDDGLMTWTVRVSDGASFFLSKKAGRARVFNPFAVVGYPRSFSRLFCALQGIMREWSGRCVMQMAYGGCQGIALYPRCIGLPDHRSTPFPEDSERGHTTEQLIKAPYEPKKFNPIVPADQITHDLVRDFYQAYGYPQEDIPFWDDTVKVFGSGRR